MPTVHTLTISWLSEDMYRADATLTLPIDPPKTLQQRLQRRRICVNSMEIDIEANFHDLCCDQRKRFTSIQWDINTTQITNCRLFLVAMTEDVTAVDKQQFVCT